MANKEDEISEEVEVNKMIPPETETTINNGRSFLGRHFQLLGMPRLPHAETPIPGSVSSGL